jgi:4Fe-4S single cluster domain of Ferredoxin I
MNAELQTYVSFHLTGRAAGDLEPFDPLHLRPALFARYRDLTSMRYDFPLVLAQPGSPDAWVLSLSGIVDGVLADLGQTQAPDLDRVSSHLLRLEREMRTVVAEGATGLLSDLWATAAERIGRRGDDTLGDSLDRARACLAIDGEVVDCDRALPARLLTHAWRVVQAEKSRRLRGVIHELVVKLSDILRADFVGSEEGRTAASLEAAIGSPHEAAFDFQALSRVLEDAGPRATLTDTRRNRIRRLVSTLESQRFYPPPGADRRPAGHDAPLEFIFDDCLAATTAHRTRLPRLVELAAAIGMAELEVGGEYNDSRHDAFFAALGPDDLSADDLALFPDYLVTVDAGSMAPEDHAALTDLLSSGMPAKVIVQSDDLATDAGSGEAAPGLGVRSRQFATVAIGLNDVYVLQSAASHLYQYRRRALDGFSYRGPALFSVFSGDDGRSTSLPAYLVAAAAMESRAFPGVVYDPSAGPDWASRCDLEANPQLDLDWPVHRFAYEDADRQRLAEDVAFTLVDFLACDARYARHFAQTSSETAADGLAPAGAVIARGPAPRPDRVPFVWMADRTNALHRVLVDDKLIREARRCREMWHSLQELGGVHNSHAARLVARERRDAEARALAAAPVGAAPLVAADEPPANATAAAPAAEITEAAVAAPERASDEPYIETVRCSSCNECVQLNGRMFAYNENKQAYVADPDAGTFRQLVEAAESCQVAIIHPGKPRNPDEPGLEELLERAAAFT